MANFLFDAHVALHNWRRECRILISVSFRSGWSKLAFKCVLNFNGFLVEKVTGDFKFMCVVWSRVCFCVSIRVVLVRLIFLIILLECLSQGYHMVSKRRSCVFY